ncbi:hypothetical protein EPUS_00826 [Endocarpon pusillum Z07020]|uniref:Uncharacterized protein n=1 Tax=Endocarpon pusillum (strain Z07020 / HMAS-L-300199) TaxID=1263415 RepID=U1GRU0_ENDPU|nr:uncharacterized protein EPUS_00826 [Endocarpon pusillum Z07020]ERF74696.1 hypothetical protein EPUS_00826 [Endocarpon pusillum Z07020]
MARTIIMGRGRVPCMTTVEQYTCGCMGNKTIEERQRDCPNCQKITDAAQQDAFCLPPVTQIDIPIKCKKCERSTEEGKASPENSTVPQPEQDGSKTAEGKSAGGSEIPQQQQAPCTARLTRFICGCEKGPSVDRKPLCPRCHHISRAARQDGSCRPWLTVSQVQRICDVCMLHIEQRVSQPPQCLTTIKKRR